MPLVDSLFGFGSRSSQRSNGSTGASAAYTPLREPLLGEVTLPGEKIRREAPPNDEDRFFNQELHERVKRVRDDTVVPLKRSYSGSSLSLDVRQAADYYLHQAQTEKPLRMHIPLPVFLKRTVPFKPEHLDRVVHATTWHTDEERARMRTAPCGDDPRHHARHLRLDLVPPERDIAPPYPAKGGKQRREHPLMIDVSPGVAPHRGCPLPDSGMPSRVHPARTHAGAEALVGRPHQEWELQISSDFPFQPLHFSHMLNRIALLLEKLSTVIESSGYRYSIKCDWRGRRPSSCEIDELLISANWEPHRWDRKFYESPFRGGALGRIPNTQHDWKFVTMLFMIDSPTIAEAELLEDSLRYRLPIGKRVALDHSETSSL